MSQNTSETFSGMPRKARGENSGLVEQVQRLCALVEQQQAEIGTLRARLETVEGVSGSTAPARTPSNTTAPQPKSTVTSRRRLLAGAGAAAAVAAAALVASEGQSARAAGTDDGQDLVIGQGNTASSTTSLTANVGSSATKLFSVDATNSTGGGGPSSSIAIFGAANQSGPDGIGGNSIGVYGQASAGTGVYGESSGLWGVHGYNPSGTGVFGYSGSGTGVQGTTSGSDGYGVAGITSGSSGTGVYGEGNATGTGVLAHSGTGYAVWAIAPSGTAVVGWASSGIDLATGTPGIVGSGRIFQGPQTTAGAPTSGAYSTGESIRDSNGDLHLCIQGGSPGKWKKVTAIPSGTTGGALVLFPAPFRVYDTRSGVGAQGGGGPMLVGQTIVVNITGVVDPANSSIVVPAGATGIIGDLIAISPSGTGFLGIQPHTGSPNSRAWVDYQSGVTLHNSVVVGLSSDGMVDVQCSLAASGMGLTITGYII